MNPIPNELGGRDQRECPLMEPGMGQLELKAAPHEILRHEEIEIEHPRTPPLFVNPIPSGRGLELSTPVKQTTGISRPPEKEGGVAVIGLGRSEGAGSPQLGHGNNLSGRGQRLDGGGEGDRGVTEIRTESDHNEEHGFA